MIQEPFPDWQDDMPRAWHIPVSVVGDEPFDPRPEPLGPAAIVTLLIGAVSGALMMFLLLRVVSCFTLL